MTTTHDNARPNEHVRVQLSTGVEATDLPAEMLCPTQHHVQRHIVIANLHLLSELPIAYYVCPTCTVVYRYQECTLPPGEEGHP
jgi:hypothetical protein